MPSVEKAEQLAQSLKTKLDAIKNMYDEAMLDVRDYIKERNKEQRAAAEASKKKEAVKDIVARKTKANGKVETEAIKA